MCDDNDERKSSNSAFLWALRGPGFGQFYNGQYGKGFLLMLGPIAWICILGIVYWHFDLFEGKRSHVLLVWLIILMLFPILVSWIYGFVDATSTADEIRSQQIRANLDQSDKARRNDMRITGISNQPPSSSSEGFKRKVKGKVNYKPFDPIE